MRLLEVLVVFFFIWAFEHLDVSIGNQIIMFKHFLLSSDIWASCSNDTLADGVNLSAIAACGSPNPDIEYHFDS